MQSNNRNFVMIYKYFLLCLKLTQKIKVHFKTSSLNRSYSGILFYCWKINIAIRIINKFILKLIYWRIHIAQINFTFLFTKNFFIKSKINTIFFANITLSSQSQTEGICNLDVFNLDATCRVVVHYNKLE